MLVNLFFNLALFNGRLLLAFKIIKILKNKSNLFLILKKMEEINELIDSYIESIKKWYYEWIISYSDVDKYFNFNF